MSNLSAKKFVRAIAENKELRARVEELEAQLSHRSRSAHIDRAIQIGEKDSDGTITGEVALLNQMTAEIDRANDLVAGHIVTDEQIDAAWMYVKDIEAVCEKCPGVMEELLSKCGIVRCEGCGGCGLAPYPEDAILTRSCPDCNGKGWTRD